MYVELHAVFGLLVPARRRRCPRTSSRARPSSATGALALVDRDGVSARRASSRPRKAAGIRPLVGAELTLAGGGCLPLLVESRAGYQNLCRADHGHEGRGGEGRRRARARRAGGGADRRARRAARRRDARATRPTPTAWRTLLRVFGARNVAIDVQRHRRRRQEAANQALLDLADALGAARGRHERRAPRALGRGRALLDVFTCIREKTTLATAGRLLAENAERHLKPPRQMEALFRDRPDLLRNTEALAERLAFTLEDLGYRFPDYPVPPGETMHSLPAPADRGGRARPLPARTTRRRAAQIERELALIGKLELAGYFLIVWDIVHFCRRERHPRAGPRLRRQQRRLLRLGITAVDPVGMELLFERFLSEERGEWPDIDLDLPSGDRRERVIQYVYETLRRARRGHDRERHHLPRAERRARDRQGAGHPAGRDRPAVALPAPVRVRGPARHARASAWREARLRPGRPAHPALRPALRRRSRTCRATSASTRAAW